MAWPKKMAWPEQVQVWARLELRGREMFVVFEKKVKMERLGT